VETATPEFIRWSLGHECTLRLACNGDEPERVERQLKALRTYADSVATHRQLDDICFEPALDVPPGPSGGPRGFRAAEVLNAYGVSSLESPLPCVSCPVHVDRKPGASSLAGCFGLVDWSAVAASWPEIMSNVFEQIAPLDQWRHEFLPTYPSWNGLWVDSPLSPPQLPLVQNLLERLLEIGIAWREIFERFVWAIRVARELQRPLYVAYFPAGRLSGRHWTVDAHCSRCKSSWPSASRVCLSCGLDARPVPARKRLRQGSRPYWPLADFLGPQTQVDLLRRYLGSRQWSTAQIDTYLRRIEAVRESKDSTNEQV